MAIELKEILGYKLEDANKYKYKANYLQENDMGEGTDPLKGTSLNESSQHNITPADSSYTVNIEAMHCAPYTTGNYTRYMASACKNSLREWKDPYKRPLILYHNDYDGTIIGRVTNATMSNSPRSNTECLMLSANVPLKEHQRQVDGDLYLTTSIGASGNDVRCSICGQQLANGIMCEHERGEIYDGKLCTWDIYDMTPKEISVVINPSDKYSGIVSKVKLGESGSGIITENQDKEPIGNNAINIKESANMPEGAKTNKENNTDTMNFEEEYKKTLKMVESLQTAEKTLNNDKIALNDKIDALTKEKLEVQEALQSAKADVSAKETELASQKTLNEELSKKLEESEKEVKSYLVDTLTAMRESAGKPKIEKLEERSMESLRNSIADLKADIDAAKLEESKKKIQDPTVKDDLPGASVNVQQKQEEPAVAHTSSFDGL